MTTPTAYLKTKESWVGRQAQVRVFPIFITNRIILLLSYNFPKPLEPRNGTFSKTFDSNSVHFSYLFTHNFLSAIFPKQMCLFNKEIPVYIICLDHLQRTSSSNSFAVSTTSCPELLVFCVRGRLHLSCSNVHGVAGGRHLGFIFVGDYQLCNYKR